jgi:hypothetical protein
MRLHRFVPVLALVVLLTAASAEAAGRSSPPPRAVVIKLLDQRYTLFARGLVPNITKLRVTVSGLRFGTPHIGDSLHDGTPANTRTMVYPVAANASFIACNPSFVYRYDYTGGKFGFFRDEYGNWAFKGLDAGETNRHLPSCPL